MIIENSFTACANSAMNRAKRSFTVATKTTGLAIRSDLRKLEDAEAKATTKALAKASAVKTLSGGSKLDVKPAPKAKPAVAPANHSIKASGFYVCRQRQKGVLEILHGPYASYGQAQNALRRYLTKTQDDPRKVEVLRGVTLRNRTTKFATDFVEAVVRNVAHAHPLSNIATPTEKARIAKQREIAMARMALRRAETAIRRLGSPEYSKLYVVDDKRKRIVAGPFSKHKDALAALAGVKNGVVLAGRQCTNESLKYATDFKANKVFKLTVGMFAVGVTVKLNGKKVKIAAFDKAHKIVRTGSGDFFMVDCVYDPITRTIIAPNQK